MKRRSGAKPSDAWVHRTSTGLDVFERSQQKTGAWLDDLLVRLEWDDRHQAYEALGVVLHALRDRLPLAACVNLGAQLPLLLRGLYYQNWSVSEPPAPVDRHRDFLTQVRLGLLAHHLDLVSEERLVGEVAALLRSRLPLGELAALGRALPPRIRGLLGLPGLPAIGRPEGAAGPRKGEASR